MPLFPLGGNTPTMMVGLTTAITQGRRHGLMDFIKKQFIDVIQWTEDSDGTLVWRFPMAGMEIQNGGTLVVRESQMAIFVNEGQVATCLALALTSSPPRRCRC